MDTYIYIIYEYIVFNKPLIYRIFVDEKNNILNVFKKCLNTA